MTNKESYEIQHINIDYLGEYYVYFTITMNNLIYNQEMNMKKIVEILIVDTIAFLESE